MTDRHTLLCIEPGGPSNGGRPFILRPITCDVKVQPKGKSQSVSTMSKNFLVLSDNAKIKMALEANLS